MFLLLSVDKANSKGGDAGFMGHGSSLVLDSGWKKIK